MSRGTAFLIVFLALLIGGAAWFAWIVKTHGFSAREEPGSTEAFLARHVRRLAIPSGARNLVNPLSPTPLDVAEGRDHYADHCAICHANDGSGKTGMGGHMNPPAPDMRARVTQN